MHNDHDDDLQPIGLINRDAPDFGDPVLNRVIDQLTRPEAYNDDGSRKTDAQVILETIRQRMDRGEKLRCRKLPVTAREWDAASERICFALESVDTAIHDRAPDRLRIALQHLRTETVAITADILGRRA